MARKKKPEPTDQPVELKNMSPEALEAVREFRRLGISGAKWPAKLKGPNDARIRRAVKAYFLG